MNINKDNMDDGSTLEKATMEANNTFKTVEGNNGEAPETAWDDVSGAALDPKAVKKARQEEIEYVKKMSLYDQVPVSECLKKNRSSTNQLLHVSSNMIANAVELT